MTKLYVASSHLDATRFELLYNNRIAPYNAVGCGSHTDGNGIIMDTFLNTNTPEQQRPHP
jgi:hypothetical protein